MEILIFLAVLIFSVGFCWYVSPYRQSEASNTQRLVATIWLLFRRIICFLGAIFCIIFIGVFSFSDIAWSEKIFPIGMFLVILLVCVYVGAFGQGWVQYTFSDDFILYKKLKEKYKWRI